MFPVSWVHLRKFMSHAHTPTEQLSVGIKKKSIAPYGIKKSSLISPEKSCTFYHKPEVSGKNVDFHL